MPVVAEVVPLQAIVIEPVVMAPVVEEAPSTLTEEIQQPPLVQPQATV